MCPQLSCEPPVTQAQLEFWKELMHPQPNLRKLHIIGAHINEVSLKADSHYQAMHALNKNNTQGQVSLAPRSSTHYLS